MPRLRRLVRRLLGRSSPSATPPAPIVPVVGQEGIETAPAALLERIEQGESLLFVDVRSPEERDKMIPDARAMTVRQLQVDWKDLDVGKSVVFYCATGGQSVNAAELIRDRGVKDATCILGGLPAWEDAGGPIHTTEP